MIADIQQPFMKDVLERKIDYQKKKIECGSAVELYNSSGDTLDMMYHNMVLVSGMNDRVKLPFIEFVISSPIGEELLDEKYLEITQEYLALMGYSDACYTIIKNNDKENKHVHVYATTVTMQDGAKIDDSNNYIRSNAIMRELELKYGLEVLEKGKSSHNKTLGESQYRQYFFDAALRKALRSHNARERVKDILGQSENYIALNPDMNKKYTNTEWKIILGDHTYEILLNVLSKGKFFNPLFKDELLSVMDRLYQDCENVKELRDRLENEGYYMRLITDKGKSHYVYGIPDRGFYVKDTALPERYRFGKMTFDGQKMTEDEQKHYLYNILFSMLHKSSDYNDFKIRMEAIHIKVIEHVNKKGINGLSFLQEGIDVPVEFKATDISRRLTYRNIQKYFDKLNTVIAPEEISANEGDNSLQKEDDKSKPGVSLVDGSSASASIFGEEDGIMPGAESKPEPEDKSKPGANDKENKQQDKIAIETITECYINNKLEWERELNYMAGSIGNLLLDNTGKKHKKDDEELLPKKKKKHNKGLSR